MPPGLAPPVPTRGLGAAARVFPTTPDVARSRLPTLVVRERCVAAAVDLTLLPLLRRITLEEVRRDPTCQFGNMDKSWGGALESVESHKPCCYPVVPARRTLRHA